MCGIAGIFSRNSEPVDGDLLVRMTRTLSHRGPDEEGHLIEGGLGFFHKRLSIIDLPTGKQPMTCEHASIVFNGAVYNYRELREDLKARGRSFRTHSDTEVILHLLARSKAAKAESLGVPLLDEDAFVQALTDGLPAPEEAQGE